MTNLEAADMTIWSSMKPLYFWIIFSKYFALFKKKILTHCEMHLCHIATPFAVLQPKLLSYRVLTTNFCYFSHTILPQETFVFLKKKNSESFQQSNFVLDMICGPSHNSWELNPFKSFSNIYWIKDDINIFCCLLLHNFPDCI